MKSIQSRLGTGLLISLITLFFLLWLLVSSSIQKLAEDYIVSRLHHDMETILTTIDFNKDNKIVINTNRIDHVYQTPFSGHYYIIQFEDEKIRSRSLWDQSMDTPATTQGNYITTYIEGPEQQTLIVVSSTFYKTEHSLSISVAEDLSPIIRNIEKFNNYFTFLSAGLLLALLIIQVWILRAGLKPLNNIQSQLTDLEQGKITHLNNSAPAELKPLIFEINHLLNVLQQRLKRSRDALSDLSHAIKKPLTVMQQLNHQKSDMDLAEVDQKSVQSMSEQINNIQQLTDRILKRARLSAGSYSGALFNFNADLQSLVSTIKAMYPDRNIHIDSRIESTISAAMDREDILELLGNLLDNAYKWAKSKIIISIAENEALRITIEDNGKGSSFESLNQLIQRGVRLDENVSGYGFGLAIASDIVKDYEGTLAFERSTALGGFKVVIELPVKR